MTAGNGPARSPGLRVRRSSYPDVDVRVIDPETGPRAHRSLLQGGLDDIFLSALSDIASERITETRCRLWDIDADAAGGAFASIAAEAVHRDRPDLVDELLALATSLGSGQTPIDIRSDRSDLVHGPARVLEAADVVPSLSVKLTGGWFDRSREHREDVLGLVVDLARGCDVVLETTTLSARRLYELHRADLPTSVTARLDPRAGTAHRVDAGSVPERLEETVAQAQEHLSPDGSATAVLQALSAAESNSLSYPKLESQLCLSDGHARVLAHRLDEEYGLAERLPRPDGTTELSLQPAGAYYLESLAFSDGLQSRLNTSYSANSTSGEDCNNPPKILPPCRVNPREDGGGEEAQAAVDGDRTDRWQHGAVFVDYMARSRHAALSGAARSGEISLIDASLDRFDDGRQPAWSYDATQDQLAVGAEFHNPLQWMTCIARALSCPLTWDRVLTTDRLEAESVFDTDTRLLQHARNLGWMTEDDASPARYIDRLQEAHDRLLEMLRDHRHENYHDRDAHRREIMQFCHGLHGAVSQLLDLCGVDLVRELRLPTFSRHWSDTTRRAKVCRTLGFVSAIASNYGHHVPYRHLYEEDSDRRSKAVDLQIDGSDPYAELIGSIVVAGNGVEDLEQQLGSLVESPKELHEDAPELAVRVPVRSGMSPLTTRRTAKSMGSAKNLDVRRQCLAWLHTLCRSPYAIAEAFDALETEAFPREMFADELRLGVGSLEEDQLLPEATPAARSGVMALLRVESDISQADLCRRADISPQSWRNHRDALAAAGLVEKTPGGWRLRLPFQEDRYADFAPPWTLSPESDQLPAIASRTQADLLMEVAETTGGWTPAVSEALVTPYETSDEEFDAALNSIDCDILSSLLEAGTVEWSSANLWDYRPSISTLGPDIQQTALDSEGCSVSPKIQPEG